MEQIEMVSLEDLVAPTHTYREFHRIWRFHYAEKQLKKCIKANPNEGFGLLRLFKCLLLQFMENLSDRECEKFLQENNSAKWFCGFSLLENTPDHTVFCNARKRIGTKVLSKIFSNLRDQLKSAGVMSEVFTFVDAAHLISKSHLWKERDEAIKARYETFNNEVLSKIAKDKQAKIGCKGKDKFWYGYKQQTSVDMQSGLINKVAIRPANEIDGQGLKHVCPSQGAIYGDKAYCIGASQEAAFRKGCFLRAIKKNNMKGKNRDLDRWHTALRAPYERVFSQREKRVRYCGIAKNQFAVFMQAISFNLKRLVTLEIPDFVLT